MLASYDAVIAPRAPKGVGKVVKKKIDGMPNYLCGFTVGKRKVYSSWSVKRAVTTKRR